MIGDVAPTGAKARKTRQGHLNHASKKKKG
jgi:hypothetical protein